MKKNFSWNFTRSLFLQSFFTDTWYEKKFSLLTKVSLMFYRQMYLLIIFLVFKWPSARIASLRIQPSLIRSRYCVRKAKIDVCDSPPEIPYWWRKSVLNSDRSADWLTDQFCMISSTIIQCCDVQKSYGENLSSPSLAFTLFVQCSVQVQCVIV